METETEMKSNSGQFVQSEIAIVKRWTEDDRSRGRKEKRNQRLVTGDRNTTHGGLKNKKGTVKKKNGKADKCPSAQKTVQHFDQFTDDFRRISERLRNF
jgi:hypothetical protein